MKIIVENKTKTVIYFYPFCFLKIKTQLNPTQLSQTVVSPLNWFSYFSQVLNKAKCEFRSSEFFRFPMFSQPTNGASLPQFSKKHSRLRDTTQLGSKIKIKINNNFFSSSSIFSPTKKKVILCLGSEKTKNSTQRSPIQSFTSLELNFHFWKANIYIYIYIYIYFLFFISPKLSQQPNSGKERDKKGKIPDTESAGSEESSPSAPLILRRNDRESQTGSDGHGSNRIRTFRENQRRELRLLLATPQRWIFNSRTTARRDGWEILAGTRNRLWNRQRSAESQKLRRH